MWRLYWILAGIEEKCLIRRARFALSLSVMKRGLFRRGAGRLNPFGVVLAVTVIKRGLFRLRAGRLGTRFAGEVRMIREPSREVQMICDATSSVVAVI